MELTKETFVDFYGEEVVREGDREGESDRRRCVLQALELCTYMAKKDTLFLS